MKAEEKNHHHHHQQHHTHGKHAEQAEKPEAKAEEELEKSHKAQNAENQNETDSDKKNSDNASAHSKNSSGNSQSEKGAMPPELESVPKFLYLGLEKENKALQEKLDQVLAAHRRAVEEHQKITERQKAEQERAVDFGVMKVLRDFVDTMDNLERTLSWAKMSQSQDVKNFGIGLEMIMQGFKDKLKSHQIEILPALGQAFNPNHFEAIELIELVEKEKDGLILEELSKAYSFKGQLLRPGQVKVGKLKGK